MTPDSPTRNTDQQFRYAICAELFQNWDLERTCAHVQSLGYTGIELTAFTMTDHVDHLSADDRRGIRDTIARYDLTCVGLHWLLAPPPEGLHITTPDDAVRAHSWEYLRKLITLCQDLGGTIMVLGSPQQRSTQGGRTAAEAADIIRDGLAALGPYAEERGVRFLLEPLVLPGSDVIDTMREAAAIVSDINHPAIQTIYDFSHTLNDPPPKDALIPLYQSMIAHVHATMSDGTHCGRPGDDPAEYLPIWRALRDIEYAGWISLEVFKFDPGPETIAREGMAFFNRMEALLAEDAGD